MMVQMAFVFHGKLKAGVSITVTRRTLRIHGNKTRDNPQQGTVSNAHFGLN
jgi:hypothetical protein